MTPQQLSELPIKTRVKLLQNDWCDICDAPQFVDETGTHQCGQDKAEYGWGEITRSGAIVQILWDDGLESVIYTANRLWESFVDCISIGGASEA